MLHGKDCYLATFQLTFQRCRFFQSLEKSELNLRNQPQSPFNFASSFTKRKDLRQHLKAMEWMTSELDSWAVHLHSLVDAIECASNSWNHYVSINLEVVL